MTTLMQSIITLINQELRKLTERMHEEFPHTSSIKMLSIWCELQQIGDMPEEETQKKVVEETLARLENGTLVQSISNLINQEIRKLTERMHEEFPEITVNKMLSIWCEMQQIGGFEFTDKHGPREAPLQDEEALRKTGNTKICEHVYIKGRNASTRRKTKVKGIGEYCGKHKPRVA
jgi:hypothetical protein